MEYILHLLILIAFYTVLSQSLNLISGFSGLMSLSQAGFYGLGAYSTAILSTKFALPFWFNLPVAMIVTAVVAYLISLVALRAVDDYFIVCTLSIQVILFSLMNNWMQMTRGPLGIPGIPEIKLINILSTNKISFLLLSVVLMLGVWWILRNISKNGYGYTLRALSEDEIYAQSIGKNVNHSKMIAFTLSAMFAAIPGVLYSHYMTFIDPTSFTLNESIFILSIVIVGGLRNLFGSFLAATILILFPELLRFIGMPNDIAANIRQIVYGLMLVLLMIKGRNGMIELVTKKTT